MLSMKFSRTLQVIAKTAQHGFIIGDWDIESGWEDYLKEMKAIGVDEMLDIVQKAYDRCNKQEDMPL